MAVLGLAALDLWPGEGWNFVFGQANLTERRGGLVALSQR